jgi:hypothetical protein
MKVIDACVQIMKVLLILDFWEGQMNPALYKKTFFDEGKDLVCTLNRIPPKCTLLCQPCSCVFLQTSYKLYWEDAELPSSYSR